MAKYLTAQTTSLIGYRSDRVRAVHAVEASEVRRFAQATMDFAERYRSNPALDAVVARYGGAVAPAGFPLHAFRDGIDANDFLEAMHDPDFDGFQRRMRPGLPAIDIPLKRIVNGGYEYEFFRYARIGEELFMESSYRDIYEREGRTGPMVFVVIDDECFGGDGTRILSCSNTMIFR